MLDRSPDPWPPWAKGILLAAANVLVIACAVSVELENHTWKLDLGDELTRSEVPVTIVSAGIVPALIVGAILGWLARLTERVHPLWRLLVLVVPACGLVLGLAALSEVFVGGLLHFVPHACVPTCVAALILEQTTRKPQAEVIPPAAIESR
jgi:hypothetical protein